MKHSRAFKRNKNMRWLQTDVPERVEIYSFIWTLIQQQTYRKSQQINVYNEQKHHRLNPTVTTDAPRRPQSWRISANTEHSQQSGAGTWSTVTCLSDMNLGTNETTVARPPQEDSFVCGTLKDDSPESERHTLHFHALHFLYCPHVSGYRCTRNKEYFI